MNYLNTNQVIFVFPDLQMLRFWRYFTHFIFKKSDPVHFPSNVMLI